MQQRPLGTSGLMVTPVGFGAFKIGRNQNAKYPDSYELPDDRTAERLLNAVLDLGITYIDTAPAYGISEERIGRFLSHRRGEFVLSTKVGESFDAGRSSYDFSASAVRESVSRSLDRLRTDVLDLVFIHSRGDDLAILDETDAVPTLKDLQAEGLVRAIGLSGKTVEGARQSLQWADAVMVEYHVRDRSHEPVMAGAAEKGVGVIVKKGLASGHLSAEQAVAFVLRHPAVSSLVVGSLNVDHLRANLAVAERVLRLPAA